MKDDGSLYVSRFCEAYLDWNSLGKALMKRDGTRWSEQGTVLCVMSGIASELCGERFRYQTVQSAVGRTGG